MAEDRARWMADLLATSIQVSGLSEEELELRLGWTSGSVARLLEGEGDLPPEQFLRMLGELHGEGPQGGADLADLEDDRTQVVTNLLDRFQLLGYELTEVAPPAEGNMNLPELEKRVESILRKAFGSSLDEKD
ncbi:MAG TPA: hypothetical protein VNM67_05180 [Thermoanaerobaculia bacterium]|jgi:hypothetical protein|nr:hypothetical protein [Thermoanaerobaculia bacterium]